MYGPPPPCRGRDRPNDSSLHKCIRPLASGLLFRPGHDQIRAHRSRLISPGTELVFLSRAYVASINCGGIPESGPDYMRVCGSFFEPSDLGLPYQIPTISTSLTAFKIFGFLSGSDRD